MGEPPSGRYRAGDDWGEQHAGESGFPRDFLKESSGGPQAVVPRLFVKEASGEPQAERLQREAGVLQRLTHPGVVELIAFSAPEQGRASLTTRYAADQTIAGIGDLQATELAALGAAVATIVADLHDMGVAHCNLRAGHVLIAEDGRPVLCGFGDSTFTALGSRETTLDVLALGDLLRERLPPRSPRELRRVLARCSTASRSNPSIQARQLAARLAAIAGTTPLPSPAPRHEQVNGPEPPGQTLHRGGEPGADTREKSASPLGEPHRRRRLPRRSLPSPAWLTLPLAAALATFIWAWVAQAQPGSRSHLTGLPHRKGVSAQIMPCPRIDASCRGVALKRSPTFGRRSRYVISIRDAEVALGRFHCGAVALPVLLEADSGRVWLFDRWPTGAAPVKAHLIARVPWGSRLIVRPEADGCDGLEVLGAGGRTETIETGRGGKGDA